MIVYRDVVVNGTTTQTKIFDIAECTYTGKDMGERSIVANIKWPSPIDFEIGDYVMLPMQSLVRSANGVDGSVLSGMDMERFYIYSMPTIKKNARPLSSGQAFEHTVTFYPAQYELGLIQMRDCGQEQANADTIIYTGFDSLSFVGGADELMRRIMAVLKEAYHDADGNPLWSYQIADAANENKNTALERVSFSFSGNSVMDALLKLNDKEGLNTSFFINGRTIYVGYKRPYFCRVTDGGSIDTNPDTQMFQFEYGKTSHQSIAINHGGLYQIIKTLGKETPITKLFAYGAARNLNRYYCSDRIKSGRYVNRVMLPSFDSDGKTDYILSEEGVKKYGIRESSKQFEEVYPSLRYMTYGDLRQIKYCVKVRYSGITNDKLEQGGSAYPVARVQCYKVVPSSKTTGINKLVEAAPPDDLCVIVHAMGKTVKVVLYGGNTDDEAIQKQRQHDSKVPTRTANGTNYIPGSCFLVHDRGFDTNKTYQNANRSAWFTNPNSFPTSLTDAQKTEINMNQIQYEDTFWLSDLYVFEGYGQMHFSRDGYSAWSWPRTNIDYMGGSADSTAVNEVVAAEPIVIEDTSSNVDDLTTQQKTFDLYLKDVGFQIDEQNDFGDMVFVVGSTLKISMLDGLMAGREFEAAGKVTDSQYTCICAYKEDGSLNDDFFMDSDYNKGKTIPQAALNAGAIWRVCCSRINLDEADYSNLNLILPTKDLCVKKGDHLVFLDIFMPDIYIHAAENRLLREARKYLEANDSGNVTYSAQFDKVRLQQIPNYALQMREGLNIRMVDDDLDISTENDGRYLSNYGEKGLYSAIDVPYTRSAWEYVTTYKTATAHSGVTQEFIDKFGRAVPESGSTYMTVRIVLQYDETWIDRAPVQIIQSGTTYNLGVPKRVLSYGWSEIDGGYLYMLIFATPSGLNLSNSATIKRHQIKADSALKKSVWLSSNDAIDFTRGRFYTFKCSVKDTGYLAAANALALFSTKNDGIDGAKYLPTYTVQAEHKEKSGLLYLTFKFELPSNFNDDVVYYPSVLFNTDSRESSVGMWVESMYEKDFADGTNKLNYADFTIDSLTIKITDSSDGAPIREISATFAENPAATTWATLMANIETVKIDGEQNVKAIETLVNTARKNYQTLLNLRNSIFDPDGTCDQTFLQVMMLQVGADSMNYQLDKTRTGLSANGQQVFHNCSCKKDGSGKWHFEVDAADTLRHFVYTQGGQGGTWAITNGIDVSLDGKSNYFVCVKCSREGNNGIWICSTKQYAVNDEEDTTAWFFNWGILTVDSTDNYTLVETRGNAYMYGDNLVCGKISTLAGNSYFDLTHGNFVLSDGTSKALSYENGILTIGGVNDESADSILARLGLTENVANNAQSSADDALAAANEARYISYYTGGDLSLSYNYDNPKNAGLVSNLPRGTYKTAIASEDNGLAGYDGAKDGFEHSCLVWFKAGTYNNNVTIDVLSSMKNSILAVSDWGVDVTISQSADVAVFTCIKGIVQAVINGSVINNFPTNGTWTINGIQVLSLLSDAIDVAKAEIKENKEYTDSLITVLGDSLQNQIDGVVDSYFQEGKPTNTNYPANEWTTDELKKRHEGDTYTNIQQYTKLGASVWESGAIGVGAAYKSKAYTDCKYGMATSIRTKELLANQPNQLLYVPSGYTIYVSRFDSSGKYIGSAVESATSFKLPTDAAQIAIQLRASSNITPDIADTLGLCVNPDAGKSWRWCKGTGDSPATTWHWHEIADSDAVRALQNAAKAQDTADGKRRVFVVQPTPPYDLGDLWAQGSGDGEDILKCKTAKTAGQTFEQADWEPASSALTALNNMQVGVRNLFAKKYMLDWNTKSSGTTTVGVDSYGEYYQVKENQVYSYVGGSASYNDILQGKVSFATGKQYCLKVQWRVDSAKTAPGLYLGFKYSDGTRSDWILCAKDQTTPAEATLISASGKTVAGIVCTYSTQANTRIYEIQLTEGNKAPGGWTEAEEDKETGGENLYTGDNPYTTQASTSNYNYTTLVSGLQNNARYVFSCGKSVVKAGSTTEYTVLLYAFGAHTATQTHKLAVGTTRVEQAFTVPSTGTWSLLLYSGVHGSTAGISIEFTDIMVQKGNRATAYQTAVGFLGKAIKDMDTTVSGGLLMTGVMMLKDTNNKTVTAGMSGLTENEDGEKDNVLMWGGGTYFDAFNAAADTTGNYKKRNGTPITTLLKKDGTGKIGIFKISDTQAIVDVPNQGKVVIDASTANGGIFIKDSGGIDRVVVSPLSLDSFGVASTHNLGTASILKNINETEDKDLSGTVSFSKSFTAGKTGTLESSFSIITEMSARVMINNGKGYPSATAGYNTLYVNIKDTTSGTTVFFKSLAALSVTANANNTTTSNTQDSKYDGKTYSVSVKIQVVKEHNYTLSISGDAVVRGYIGGTSSSSYDAEVHASLSITSDGAIKLLYTDMCAYLCVDGLSVAANSELKFDVMKSGTDLKVLAKGLPTSAPTAKGQLWQDSSKYIRIT